MEKSAVALLFREWSKDVSLVDCNRITKNAFSREAFRNQSRADALDNIRQKNEYITNVFQWIQPFFQHIRFGPLNSVGKTRELAIRLLLQRHHHRCTLTLKEDGWGYIFLEENYSRLNCPLILAIFILMLDHVLHRQLKSHAIARYYYTRGFWISRMLDIQYFFEQFIPPNMPEKQWLCFDHRDGYSERWWPSLNSVPGKKGFKINWRMYQLHQTQRWDVPHCAPMNQYYEHYLSRNRNQWMSKSPEYQLEYRHLVKRIVFFFLLAVKKDPFGYVVNDIIDYTVDIANYIPPKENPEDYSKLDIHNDVLDYQWDNTWPIPQNHSIRKWKTAFIVRKWPKIKINC
jgi:hypothetical protein